MCPTGASPATLGASWALVTWVLPAAAGGGVGSTLATPQGLVDVGMLPLSGWDYKTVLASTRGPHPHQQLPFPSPASPSCLESGTQRGGGGVGRWPGRLGLCRRRPPKTLRHRSEAYPNEIVGRRGPARSCAHNVAFCPASNISGRFGWPPGGRSRSLLDIRLQFISPPPALLNLTSPNKSILAAICCKE